MNISDCMTREVRLIGPDATIQEAARLMAECDSGALPVSDDDRLIGMITDRDIAIRAIAQGLGPDAKVGEAMSGDLCYCYEDQPVGEVLRNMSELQIRRMPVVNRQKRLVGVVSLGDLARAGETHLAGAALNDISQPGGQHSQTTH